MDNSLKPYKIKSKVDTDDYKDITSENMMEKIRKAFPDTAGAVYFVAYLDYKVAIGCYKDNKFILPDNVAAFDKKHIQKIRIFSKTKELLIWRKGADAFSGRLWSDEEGKEEDAIDAYQVLWGTKKPDNGEINWTKVTEDRGTELTFPFKLDEDALPVKLWTRNYIGYNEIFQARYIDCRFVGFTDKDNSILRGGDIDV